MHLHFGFVFIIKNTEPTVYKGTPRSKNQVAFVLCSF